MRGLTLSARWVAVAMVIALILAYLLQASSVSEATDLPALLESVAALAGIRYGSLSVARLFLGVALLGLVWETSLRSPARARWMARNSRRDTWRGRSACDNAEQPQRGDRSCGQLAGADGLAASARGVGLGGAGCRF